MTVPAPDPRLLVLGIETSCDDTACAVVDGEGRVLSSVVSSQLAAHRPYGGVVPEIASREHLRSWPPVSAAALGEAGVGLGEVGAVAATRGPGLVGSLLVGLSLGKAIAYALGRPFYAVHHLEGHLYSPFLAPPAADGSAGEAPEPARAVPERFVGLVVSGGHTNLFSVEGDAVATLAETRDDAMGEVFDKLGKRLGLPYPQGPRVDALAERGDAEGRFRFTVAACGDDRLDFSYSGLKSQALAAVTTLEREGVAVGLGAAGDRSGGGTAGAGGGADGEELEPPGALLDLFAAFRAAAVAQLIDRLERLWRRRPFDLLALSGGVAANRLLRREAAAWCAERGVELAAVPLAYAGDNAAMIAHAALLRQRRGESDDPFTAEAASRIRL
jgi:N6-L-threonylcarbamoyladenine synthase